MDREQTTAERVRKRIERHENHFWHLPGDFSDEGHYDAVLRQLARMVDAHELIRVRRGLYWRGRSSSAGMVHPSPLQVVQALIGEAGVGYAGGSAAYALGLSFQALKREEIAIPVRPPRAITSLQADFVSRAGRTGRLQQHLTAREVALLEVLSAPELITVAREMVMEKLSTLLLHSEDVRPKHLVKASRSEPALVRQGLLNLLESVGQDEEARRILPVRSKSARARALLAPPSDPDPQD